MESLIKLKSSIVLIVANLLNDKYTFNFIQFFREFRTVFFILDKTLDKNSCPKKKLGGILFQKKRKKLLEPVGLLVFFSRKN